MERAAKDTPHYTVTVTLLGGTDVNRRSIHRYVDHKQICVFNQWMDRWTPEDERLLRFYGANATRSDVIASHLMP